MEKQEENDMICRSCGFIIKDRARTCPYCNLKDPDLYGGRKDGEAAPRRHTPPASVRPVIPAAPPRPARQTQRPYTVQKPIQPGMPSLFEQLQSAWSDMTTDLPRWGTPGQPLGQNTRSPEGNVQTAVGIVIAVIFAIIFLMGIVFSIY